MKTFPATHLNKHAKEVFAAAKDDGSVVIEHYGYLGGVFAIVWNPDIKEPLTKDEYQVIGQMLSTGGK